jgi:tetratricopeptide (TPR) repeat protein
MMTGSDILVDTATLAGLLTWDQPADDDTVPFLLDALSAAPDEALDHLSRQIECHTAGGENVDPLLRTLRAKARTRHAKAAVEFLAARAAEGAGDSQTAKDLIDKALEIRPDLEPARHDAAGYAACRGDYAAAEAHLRFTRLPDELEPGLAEILAATDIETPRNKPCPCGSGKKFKACCRGRTAPSLSTRARLAYALLGTYAERGPGAEIIRPLATMTAFPEQYAMFCLDLALFHGGLVDRFLAARGHWLRADERELIDHWREIPLSVYEIVAVTRGRGATVRRLPDGQPTHLADRSFSTSVRRLDLLCGRILHDGDNHRILALPVPVPRHRRRELMALLAAEPTTDQIAGFFAPEPPPHVQNLDGDDVHDCRVTYRVPNPEAVFGQLTGQLTQTGGDVLSRLRDLPDGRALNEGEISREGARFILTANSPKRLAWLEEILRAAAPAAVESDRRAERPYPEPAGRVTRKVIFETYFVDGTENEAGANASLAAEEGWLDTPRVIGDLSPREAAASGNPSDLAELHATVNDIEYNTLQAERGGRPTDMLMDADRLRSALSMETP